MADKCETIVVCCIDFRFQKYIRKFTDENLKNKLFDLVGLAGSSKNLKIILKQIEISVKLHHIKEVFLIHHEECGAYGKRSTFLLHKRELNKAKREILKKFPKLKVKTYYFYLDGTYQEIK